jgi:hypothetical protein
MIFMKFTSKVSLQAISALVLLLAAFPVMAQQTVDRVARINALAGDVRYSSKDGAWVPAAVGTKLHAGDKVKTGVSSHADIDIGGNVGIVQVASKSVFVIEKITSTDAGAERVTETQLSVNDGAIYAKINKLAKGSRYEIATPKGIAGIRGTATHVTSEGQTTILDGSAGVAFPKATNTNGVETIIVKAGETGGPNDNPPHPASPELLRQIVEALRDASTHGVGPETPPFAQPLAPFISPVLPRGGSGGQSVVVDSPSQDL